MLDTVKEWSPGLDYIKYKEIKYLLEEIRELLLALYSEIMQDGDCPSEGKQYAVFSSQKQMGKSFDLFHWLPPYWRFW